MGLPCVCGRIAEEGFMVYCDGDDCNTWFHGKCLSLTAKKLENVEKWYCPTCAKIEHMKKYVDRKHTDLSNSLDKKLCGIININNNTEESQPHKEKISKRKSENLCNNNFVPKQQKQNSSKGNTVENKNAFEDLSQEKENLLKEVEKLRSYATELDALQKQQKLEHEKAVTDLCQEKKDLVHEIYNLRCCLNEIEDLNKHLAQEVETLKFQFIQRDNLLTEKNVENENVIIDLCQQKQNLIQEVQALGCKVIEIENLMELKRIEHDKTMSEMSQENGGLKVTIQELQLKLTSAMKRNRLSLTKSNTPKAMSQ